MRCKSSYLIKYSLIVAPVMKLVDIADLKSAAERREGSIPFGRTNQRVLIIVILVLYYTRSLALI